MKKAWIIVIFSVFFVFVAIQFFPPAKNDKILNPQDDIVFKLDIPVAVKKKIVDACYDCHSNKTVYPFYNNIAPVSWIMANHVHEGKAHLNFSEWANYDRKQQIKLLDDICEEVKAGEMPIKGYVFMHSRAVINPKEIEDICQWTAQASDQVMNKKD